MSDTLEIVHETCGRTNLRTTLREERGTLRAYIEDGRVSTTDGPISIELIEALIASYRARQDRAPR